MANDNGDDARILRLSEQDNVVVLIQSVPAGERLRLDGQELVMAAGLDLGHKLALRAVPAGETIVKYGAPIGSATADISFGDHVHTHNMKSEYIANYSEDDPYEAEDGS